MEIDYGPLIDTMTWSASRIKAFEQCPYGWFLHYILFPDQPGIPKFYTSYGSFMHSLLEGYYRGELTKEDMLTRFLTGFQTEVRGRRPKPSTVQKYIDSGVNYLSGFTPPPWETVGVEIKLRFRIQNFPFIGIIDHLGRDESGLIITDNKSRELQPRSGREKPTLKDKELDEMLRQLYLYAVAVEQEYGELPSKLCFNCFRNNQLIIEPFQIDAFEETKKWAIQQIEEIRKTEEFEPNENFFYCPWICEMSDRCKYNLQTISERR